MPKVHSKKLIVIGDDGVGKTSFINAYTTGSFPKVVDNTAFKIYHEAISVGDDQDVHFAIVDTPGEDDYDRIRPVLAYPNADMYLICFALNSPESLKNCARKWGKEVKFWSPMRPRFLVGLKKDVVPVMYPSNSPVVGYVSTEQALEMAAELKIPHYFECSSFSMEGVDDVFRLAAQEVLIDEKMQHRCCIL